MKLLQAVFRDASRLQGPSSLSVPKGPVAVFFFFGGVGGGGQIILLRGLGEG